MPDSRRIHIVDDDPDIAESLADLLAMKMPGAQIFTDGAPDAALERLKTWRPHLIISDFRMPGMTGVEFLAEVQKLYPDILAVLMTAYSEQRIAVDAARRGIIRRFYQKPIDVQRMIDGLMELLDADAVMP